MKKLLSVLLALVLAVVPVLLNASSAGANETKEQSRLEDAGEAMKEILNIPDDIPQDLIDKSVCVIVLPSVLKAAFGFGGSYGRGAMTCRSGDNFMGPWGAPTMMVLEGGSFGFQLGAQATDFVLLVMNPRGASSILNSKVKLGAGASAAAGPKGREAEAATDATMRAEVLTYSRSRGLFAGISLNGASLRPDSKANVSLYGRALSGTDIALHGAVPIPAAARLLISTLNQHSPKRST
ncbi:MAG TPA: lipid-binding SYLF domain-containing protein [Candidatus Acidoferrales bacterium]|nr:lipid-binding SYLF domain-containing protein [Candidatus Acidoferrales bacterium]